MNVCGDSTKVASPGCAIVARVIEIETIHISSEWASMPRSKSVKPISCGVCLPCVLCRIQCFRLVPKTQWSRRVKVDNGEGCSHRCVNDSYLDISFTPYDDKQLSDDQLSLGDACSISSFGGWINDDEVMKNPIDEFVDTFENDSEHDLHSSCEWSYVAPEATATSRRKRAADASTQGCFEREGPSSKRRRTAHLYDPQDEARMFRYNEDRPPLPSYVPRGLSSSEAALAQAAKMFTGHTKVGSGGHLQQGDRFHFETTVINIHLQDGSSLAEEIARHVRQSSASTLAPEGAHQA